MVNESYFDFNLSSASENFSIQTSGSLDITPFSVVDWNRNLSIRLIPNSTILALYFVFGLIGNGLVIVVYHCRFRNNNDDRYFIPHLAAADLSASVACSIFTFVLNFQQANFESEIFCKTMWFFCTMTTFCSIFTLLTITVERYLKVTKPLSFNLKLRTKRLVVTAIVMCSFSLAVPSTIFYGRVPSYIPSRNITRYRCTRTRGWDHSEPVYYSFVLFACSIGTPICISILYMRIGYILYQQIKFRKQFHSSKDKSKSVREGKIFSIYSKNRKTHMTGNLGLNGTYRKKNHLHECSVSTVDVQLDQAEDTTSLQDISVISRQSWSNMNDSSCILKDDSIGHVWLAGKQSNVYCGTTVHDCVVVQPTVSTPNMANTSPDSHDEVIDHVDQTLGNTSMEPDRYLRSKFSNIACHVGNKSLDDIWADRVNCGDHGCRTRSKSMDCTDHIRNLSSPSIMVPDNGIGTPSHDAIFGEHQLQCRKTKNQPKNSSCKMDNLSLVDVFIKDSPKTKNESLGYLSTEQTLQNGIQPREQTYHVGTPDQSTTERKAKTRPQQLTPVRLTVTKSISNSPDLRHRRKHTVTEKRKYLHSMHHFSWMFMLIAGVYIVCFVPKIALLLMENFDKTFWVDIADDMLGVSLFFYRLYIFNNVCNPVIYCFFDPRFRRELKILFKCKN